MPCVSSFQDQLTLASEHIVNLQEAKDKEVVGTTYKALSDLITQIHQCGYFDNLPAELEQGATEEAAAGEGEVFGDIEQGQLRRPLLVR